MPTVLYVVVALSNGTKKQQVGACAWRVGGWVGGWAVKCRSVGSAAAKLWFAPYEQKNCSTCHYPVQLAHVRTLQVRSTGRKATAVPGGVKDWAACLFSECDRRFDVAGIG